MSIVADKVKDKLAKRAGKAAKKEAKSEKKLFKQTAKTEKKAARKAESAGRKSKTISEPTEMTKDQKEADEKAQGFKKIEPVKAKVKKEVGVVGSGLAYKVQSLKGRMER